MYDKAKSIIKSGNKKIIKNIILKDGKGYIKEYDSEVLFLYEGEYFNGDRNGKGKEYYNDTWNNKLLFFFEGTYFNGQINGNGKEYYYSPDKIKFEGEYKNGEKWNGKIYNPKGIVESELKEGKGYIKKYYDDLLDLEYEGEYFNGKRNGKGKCYYIGGSLEYEGEFLNGEKHGKGKGYNLEKGNLEFEGIYLHGYIPSYSNEPPIF